MSSTTTTCGARFRDTLFVWFWLMVWAVALLVQVPAGRRDLLGTYGVVPAVLATVVALGWTIANKAVLPGGTQRLALLAVAAGGVMAAAWAIKAFAGMTYTGPILARLWEDVAQVGSGAWGTFIDYASVSCVSLAHIGVESYRRGLPSPRVQAYLALTVVVPAAGHPLFVALELPSGRSLRGSDADGATVSLGSWPPVLYGLLSLASWFIWAPSVVDMYRECGPRWRPEDFGRCGLSTTAASSYTVYVIAVFVAFYTLWQVPRLGHNSRAGSRWCNFAHGVVVKFLWAVLTFINVAAGLAAALAINYVDAGEDDVTVEIEDGSTSVHTTRSGRKYTTTTPRSRSRSASRKRD